MYRTFRQWLVENEFDDQGFWVGSGGKDAIKASGVLPIAADTGRICLNHRSSAVSNLVKGRNNYPGECYGVFGGAMKDGLSPEENAKQECAEETGYHGPWIMFQPAFLFQKGSFKYQNFIGVIPTEAKMAFQPESGSSWESEGLVWVDWHEVAGKDSYRGMPFHDGLTILLKSSASQIEQILKKYHTEDHPKLPGATGVGKGVAAKPVHNPEDWSLPMED